MRHRPRKVSVQPPIRDRLPQPPYGTVRVDGVRADSVTRSTAARPEPRISAVVARRAVDLALDGGISLDEGRTHLCRLTQGRRAPLEAALGELGDAPCGRNEEEYARHLLNHALAGLGDPRAGTA
jgi:hypothetical protein